ncbi:hypothetical protein GUJ93_ZPchr0006g43400 [Zizania palustris]|uniref:Uncharacterized protein n=1 Tax=Zizania palustris TaxID=103762 RepID=A0A8J5TDG0_ZIZPA|nr:hypothetical protein GUJ93_ZPchr0006g43400 [Zizania palustris]
MRQALYQEKYHSPAPGSPRSASCRVYSRLHELLSCVPPGLLRLPSQSSASRCVRTRCCSHVRISSPRLQLPA